MQEHFVLVIALSTYILILSSYLALSRHLYAPFPSPGLFPKKVIIFFKILLTCITIIRYSYRLYKTDQKIYIFFFHISLCILRLLFGVIYFLLELQK